MRKTSIAAIIALALAGAAPATAQSVSADPFVSTQNTVPGLFAAGGGAGAAIATLLFVVAIAAAGGT